MGFCCICRSFFLDLDRVFVQHLNMARPTKPAKDRQSKIIGVRLTPAVYKALGKVSKTTRMRESEIVRRFVEDGLQGVEIYTRRQRRKTH